jgi:hypothetical protein
MKFEVIGQITEVERIGRGPGVKALTYLRKAYGQGRWRKLKGKAYGTPTKRSRTQSRVALVRSAWHWKERHQNQILLGYAMKQPTKPFALCLDNTDYEASLVRGKIYRLLPDARAAKDDFVRIIDESGEDYLYHKSHFVFVDFPNTVKKKILALESAS